MCYGSHLQERRGALTRSLHGAVSKGVAARALVDTRQLAEGMTAVLLQSAIVAQDQASENRPCTPTDLHMGYLCMCVFSCLGSS